ncbi:MAG: hypothetical protein L3K52_15190 [Candidatus Thiothrix sulfatifontis]|nr:MAG: hypothetical protein L3K52_15190 [Candidatus Thiothrix sulfatifontis]
MKRKAGRITCTGNKIGKATRGKQREAVKSTNSRTARPLAALLAKCDPDAPTPEEAREWESTPPIGNEII